MTATTGAARVGRRGRIAAFADGHRSITVIIGMAVVAALLPLIVLIPPLPSFQGQAAWINGFSNAGVFVLLALGLNIVVGLAGLLDLGYAAFFAIGAYTYAYSNSPYSNVDLPFIPPHDVGIGHRHAFEPVECDVDAAAAEGDSRASFDLIPDRHGIRVVTPPLGGEHDELLELAQQALF